MTSKPRRSTPGLPARVAPELIVVREPEENVMFEPELVRVALEERTSEPPESRAEGVAGPARTTLAEGVNQVSGRARKVPED